jgi:hypothetical protein
VVIRAIRFFVPDASQAQHDKHGACQGSLERVDLLMSLFKYGWDQIRRLATTGQWLLILQKA